MLKSVLLQIIANGENSGVEFKRDDCRPEQLAKEIVAMANLRGGMIILGVEDDGVISGIQRKNLEEWVMDTVFTRKIHPFILPFYEEIKMDNDKRVAIVSFTQGISKPYVLRHKDREDIFVRIGSVSRLATREQQARLFDSGGLLHMEVLPISGTSIDSLDLDRLNDYLENVIIDPELPTSHEEWQQRLCGMGFMTEAESAQTVCTIAGLVLFGYKPRRYLKQAGLRVLVFNGPDKVYQAQLDEVLDGPLVGLWKKDNRGNREQVADGVIENFVQITRAFLSEEADEINDGLRRDRNWFYPLEAIREIVVNAFAHRDWSRSVDIEFSVYNNRLEVISPGALQNLMTVAKMIAGQRSPRNPLIVDVLRDYRYVDARGMGIRTKVIPLMRQINQTEPVFEDTEDFLKTTLFRRQED